MMFADILCVLNIPDFDWHRGDLHREFQHIGMPKSVGTPDREMPPWWDEVLQAAKQGKKIVAVSRSSLNFSPEKIVFPAMEGLKERDDIIVLVALVNAEPESLQGVLDIPDNVRMAKFIPMDLLLPHVDVLVTTAGYGTVQHVLRNGVPMVISGTVLDKTKIGAIAKYTGVAEFVHKDFLDPEDIRTGVDNILKDPSYKNNMMKMAEVYKGYDPIERLDGIIQERIKWFDAMTLDEKKETVKDEL